VSSIAWDAAVWTYDGTGDGVMNFIDTPGGGPAAAYGCGLRADPYTPDGVVISFTLSEAASFRLGAFNDMFDAGWGSHQNYVIDDRIELQLNAEPVVATPGASLAFNGIYDYYFFDISGQAGDVVTVSAFRQDDGPLGTFLKGIVFDSPAPIPEPATISLLVIGAMGLIARRKHR